MLTFAVCGVIALYILFRVVRTTYRERDFPEAALVTVVGFALGCICVAVFGVAAALGFGYFIPTRVVSHESASMPLALMLDHVGGQQRCLLAVRNSSGNWYSYLTKDTDGTIHPVTIDPQETPVDIVYEKRQDCIRVRSAPSETVFAAGFEWASWFALADSHEPLRVTVHMPKEFSVGHGSISHY